MSDEPSASASTHVRLTTRRTFLLAAAGAVTAACTGPGPAKETLTAAGSTVVAPGVTRDGPAAFDVATPTPTTAAPTATSTPVVIPAGSEVRTLLPGTRAATDMVIRHSGAPGPAAMILGGVHGNEPGGWGAVDEIAARWTPTAGTLIVLPRANVLAIASFVRTFDDIGDLNRLYPGNASSALLMEQMAGEIVATAREFSVDLLIDMHESWGFYRDYPGTGTGALGQTVTGGVGPRSPGFVEEVRDRLNPGLPERDQLIIRSGSPFAGGQTPTAGGTGRGRSSLGIGAHVPGLTPILVEMGQEGQEVERRIQLHLIIGQEMLEMIGVV